MQSRNEVPVETCSHPWIESEAQMAGFKGSRRSWKRCPSRHMGAQVGKTSKNRQCQRRKTSWADSLITCAWCPGMYMSLCTDEHVAACAKVPACYQTSLARAPPMRMKPAGSVTTCSLLPKPIVNDWRRQQPSQLVSHVHIDTPKHMHKAVCAQLLFTSSLGQPGFWRHNV